VKEYIYYGTVENAETVQPQGHTKCRLEQKNKFRVGDILEVLTPGTLDPKFVKVISIADDEGHPMESCPHASQMLNVEFEGAVSAGDLLRGYNPSGK